MRAAREMSTASMSCESLINSLHKCSRNVNETYNAFKGSETIAIYYFIENKQSIDCGLIQCYSVKFPEKEDKKGMCVVF